MSTFDDWREVIAFSADGKYWNFTGSKPILISNWHFEWFTHTSAIHEYSDFYYVIKSC